MRCFVAVDLDENLKEKIISLQKAFSGFDVKLVETENLHFTLKFLGEIDENTIAGVREKITNLAKETKPFDITLDSVGVFPNLTYVRVVWIGSSTLEFINLQKSILATLKMGKNEKDAKPHLTIARVRSARDKNVIADIIKKYENTNFGSMQVDKIKLKKSILTPKGPIYEDIGVFELGK